MSKPFVPKPVNQPMTKAKEQIMAGDIAVYCSHSKIVPIGELKPNPRNPNKHPKEQIILLSRIIQGTGWRHPIVVSKLSGLIVAGHARLEAAKHLAAGFAPVDYQDFKTEGEELAALLADNQVAELADLDKSETLDILKMMNDDDKLLTGFTDGDMSEMTAALSDLDEIDVQPAPGTMWVLLAIPINKFGEVREHLLAMENVSEICIKTNRD